MLARRQAEIAGEVPAGGEPGDIADRGHQRRGREHPDSGNGLELSGDEVLAREMLELPVHGPDAGLDLPDLLGRFGQGRAQQARQRRVRVAQKHLHMRHDVVGAPVGMSTPNSLSRPRTVFRRAVRVASHVVRRRCNATNACCEIDFTGTGRTSSLRNASSKPFVSMRSVLLRGAYGRTTWGGTSTTRWP